MAEITSANYFSDTTIINNQPGEGHIYNYPKVDGGNSQICEDYEVGTKKVRKYISRRSKGDCPPLSEKREADHFAAVSLLQSVVSVTDENIPRLNLWLDNNVHNTYARELIPKVIGYSAALLDYFFRGKLQVTVLPIFYQNNLSYVRLKVRNMTPNEAMERGEFALRYRYTPPGGPEDGSGDIYGQAWNLDGSLSVPCPELKSGEEQTYDFQVFDNVPVDILTSLKFILAFRGTLGNEEGAVIGKVFGPGEVKFNEEWNNGFHGNYAWFHAGIDEPVWEPGSGTVLNVVVDGRLVKENVIFPGVGGQRLNKSDVGGEGPYQDIFPILVTPRTYLQFKVDDISIARNPASPPDWKADHYQCVRFDFSKGYSLLFSQGEYDPVWDRTKTAHYTFPLGYIIVDSIHGLFERSGIQIPEGPFYLWSIGFHQLLFDAYEESEYREHMAVDFVRVVEEKENP
ncbi:MAG: hypothetical protein NTV04_18940 [Deltaproteobacteria bacterium]|nr:hypothetical protein [Deltaproteobacteria bacterium]